MERIDRERLLQTGKSYGLDLAAALDQLADYADFLVEYNEKVNLTAITDPEGIENKHFLDCLLLAREPKVAGKVVDVGTGAGFPGVVAKIYRPELQLTLMEPTGKRLEFLRLLCQRLGVEAELVKERAEEAARKSYREQYDVATARAVAGLPALCEYCLPLVRVGGLFVAMKGSGGAQELEQAEGAIQKLGGRMEEIKACVLPGEEERSLIFIRKVAPTPPVYPRNGGKIAKAPLK